MDFKMSEKASEVKKLFELWFDEPKINQAARIITGRLIAEYGYENVAEAFIEAASKDQYKLAYVRGILKKKKEQAAIKQNRLIAQKQSELIKETEGQKNNYWNGIFDEFKKKNIYSIPEGERDYKNDEWYKKAEQQFLNDLNGKK